MRLLVLIVLSCSVAAAQTPLIPYQDGVLVSFGMVSTGTGCSSNGTVSAKVQDNGTVNGTTNSTSSCSDSEMRQYIVRVGNNTFAVRPMISGKQTAGEAALVVATIGYAALFIRNRDILANQLPGAHVSIRSHGSGFQVKIGKKDSLYSIAGAQ
jgi:hypothetical protein